MVVRLAPALLAMLALAGCRPAPPGVGATTAGESSGTKSWSGTADGTGIPGLDGGSLYWVGSRFVVWAAGGRGGGGSGSSSSSSGTSGDGHVSLSGGQTLTFRYDMPAGRPGTATVNGTDYDLADGRLFLVKPDGDKLVVRQAAVDLSGVDLGTADPGAVGRANPTIREFFEAKR